MRNHFLAIALVAACTDPGSEPVAESTSLVTTSGAPWWPAAREQLLRFPFDAHDDFVDTLAYIGLGLTLQVGARAAEKPAEQVEGTFGWLKLQREQAERSVKVGFGGGGW